MTKAAQLVKKAPPKEDILHEHIVSTYFSHKTPHRRNRRLDTLKRARAALLASSIFVVSLVLISLSLVFYHHYYLNYLKARSTNAAVIRIFDAGRLDRTIIRTFEFRGYARGASKFSKGSIILASPRKYGWADLAIDFKFPIDLSGRGLVLSLKGSVGGETMTVVLRDDGNRTFRMDPVYLASAWKTERMPFRGRVSGIDLSKITHLRFESGRIGEASIDSPADVTIYIKKIEIINLSTALGVYPEPAEG